MTTKIFAAFVKAQAEIEKAAKDSVNPHFRKKYADLGNVVDAIKPALEKHGLAFFQKFHENPDGIAIETIIAHESGESFSNGVLFVPATKRDAQGYGSACTYARRYSLQAAFGVAPEDDDGNAASRSQQQEQPRQQTNSSVNIVETIRALKSAQTDEALKGLFAQAWAAASENQRAPIKAAYDERKLQLESRKETA